MSEVFIIHPRCTSCNRRTHSLTDDLCSECLESLREAIAEETGYTLTAAINEDVKAYKNLTNDGTWGRIYGEE